MEMGRHLPPVQAPKDWVCAHVCECVHVWELAGAQCQSNCTHGSVRGGPRLEQDGCGRDGDLLSPLSLVSFLFFLVGEVVNWGQLHSHPGAFSSKISKV